MVLLRRRQWTCECDCLTTRFQPRFSLVFESARFMRGGASGRWSRWTEEPPTIYRQNVSSDKVGFY